MSYQALNPYVTNIVPLYNVASQASGPTTTTLGLSNIQSLLSYDTKTLSINTIKSYTTNTTLEIANNTNISGNLTVNSYYTGPDAGGYNLNICKRFTVSTPTASVILNTKVINTIIPNFEVYINGITAFYIDSNANASFTKPILAPAYNVVSDSRYKSNIEGMTNSLSSICELQGKQYIINGMSSIGFMAQDLDLVIPSAVDKTNADKWSINYIQLIPHLVESIKELNSKVMVLESTLKGSK